MSNLNHVSVMLAETIRSLNIKENGIYIDMTLGLGGHSEAIAKTLKRGTIVCIDQDEKALEHSKNRLSQYINDDLKIYFIHSNFSNIKNILLELNLTKVDGVLMDLGTSYYQLTDTDRGFSYKGDILDMRMDFSSNSKTAQTVLNEYSQVELAKIFFEYGDVKFAKDLAREIILFRESEYIKYPSQLNQIIDRFSKMHKNNIKNIYQAIRIEVNDEISVLQKALKDVTEFLNIEGVISVITFHSLEDKVVKEYFNELKKLEHETPFEIIKFFKTSKVMWPSKEEISENKPSRSAKLRILVKKNENINNWN